MIDQLNNYLADAEKKYADKSAKYLTEEKEKIIEDFWDGIVDLGSNVITSI